MTSQERLLTYQEVADRLGVSTEWLRRRVAGRTIPFIKLGRSVRFTEEHVTLIITSGEHKPRPAPPQPLATRRRTAR